MTKRQEFPLRIRRAALERAGGFCERRSSKGCTVKLIKGKYRFDHVLPDGLGGKPALANCEVACLVCDAPKTYERDIPMMAKADRLRKKAEGIEPKHKRWSPLRAVNQTHKRKLDGSVVPREIDLEFDPLPYGGILQKKDIVD